MAFVVVYDACVLHPAPLRDLLIRIATTGVVRARWSERILDECFASILESMDLAPAAVVRCVVQQAAACRNPPVTLAELLDTLRDAKLVRSVARLREQFGPTAYGDAGQ